MKTNLLAVSLCAALTAAVAAPLALTSASVFAKAPMAGVQVPAVYRFKVGSFEVTALSDGYLALSTKLYSKIDQKAATKMLAEKSISPDAMVTSVNTYLVNTGDKLVLIDAGTSNAFGPTAGKLMANLKAAGIEGKDIDLVLLTHLHPDHVNGVLNPDGSRAFPNAEIMVHEDEVKFWTDATNTEKAPKDFKGFFLGAQKALKAYEGKVKQFKGAAEVSPGIKAVPLAGHTPGHTGFHVTSGGKSFLVWGDIVHSQHLQLARPDWAIDFDTNRAQAIASRKAILARAAKEKLLIGGMHIDFPGVGYVLKRGNGYEFLPQHFSYELK